MSAVAPQLSGTVGPLGLGSQSLAVSRHPFCALRPDCSFLYIRLAPFAAGQRTGIVTDSYIWDAPPAAFAAHAGSRDDAAAILKQFAEGQLDVLFGELEDVGEEGVPEFGETEVLLGQRFLLFGPEPVPASQLIEVPDQEPAAAIFEEDQIEGLDSTPNLPLLARRAKRTDRKTQEPTSGRRALA